MSIDEFNKAIKYFDEDLYAREEGELFLVYKDASPLDEFIGSCYAEDVEEYGIKNIMTDFGIY